ncbi:MAG: dimethylsulfonioproprionate lyase family protein [Rhodospirillales bacterium]
MLKLNDSPDWRYLLQEFYDLYRFGSAGGSGSVRTHQRTVRERLSRIMAANPEVRQGEGQRKPVCDHLGRAFDNGRSGPMGSLIHSLMRINGGSDWVYGYEKMPRSLEKKYAYTELVGPGGPVVANDLTMGLVLFGPATTYPAHSHDGIVESYVVLSGAISENDAAVYVPGSLILNNPGYEHRITTQDREPALLAYAWVGAPERLANPEMKLSGRRKKS